MPLNVPKDYNFLPAPVGAVKLITRSARKSRISIGGTYFRSVDRGEQANKIRIRTVQSGVNHAFVVHYNLIVPAEMIFFTGSAVPVFLYDTKMSWDTEIHILNNTGVITVQHRAFNWVDSSTSLLTDFGIKKPGSVFNAPGVINLKIPELGPWTKIVIRPRIKVYPLSKITVTTPDDGSGSGSTSVTGYNITSLRIALSTDKWIRMPFRPIVSSTPTPSVPSDYEDYTDFQKEGTDDLVMMDFDFTNLSTGDGLPLNPSGFNTGPDRAMVHLNYSEDNSGKMGVLNEIYEWVGDSVNIGSWKKYA